MKKEDMGEYSAYISNAAGSAYSSARLIVLSMYEHVFHITFHIKKVFIRYSNNCVLQQVQGRLCHKIKEVISHLSFKLFIVTLVDIIICYK